MIKINEIEYEVMKDNGQTIDPEMLKDMITDYYDDFTCIVGDWAYNKLRLKGFCDKNDKAYRNINSIDNVDNYIKNNCAYGCKWFLIKKIKK